MPDYFFTGNTNSLCILKTYYPRRNIKLKTCKLLFEKLKDNVETKEFQIFNLGFLLKKIVVEYIRFSKNIHKYN